MRIMIVDDEELALKHLKNVLKSVAPDSEPRLFTDSDQALAFVRENRMDVVFLDVEMPGMGGISLAKKMLEFCPCMNIIYVTGYTEYALEAFSVHASGYLLKPVSHEDVMRELKDLRNPVVTDGVRLHVQTFGNFEVFAGGVPLKFARSKTKELFAYLVDRRGAAVSSTELISILWEDRESNRTTRSMLHNLLSDLTATLREIGAQEVLVKQRNSIAISPNRLDCDYYAFLKGDKEPFNTYRGEYMRNYSWAEFTLAGMDELT